MEEKKHCKWYHDEFCTNDKSPCVADYCPVVDYPELCKCRELDNGEILANVANSLTNEEVIRGLKNWILHDCTAKPQDLTNALDLIHRLQDDYSNLKERYVKVLGLNEKVIADQKEEIERLMKLVDKWENVYGSEYWLAKHNEILKEILEAVDKESNGQTVSFTNVLRKRYGV